ncbi:hypothetical protein USDA257_c39540 [Sinorhizobium fredii USDA 257]|uniref:Uncharacterized protein n=2 Tax=Rhizobium fredii TaxID=380 RepID=I3X9E2_SINF2|nr:hypothetical protein USDA257_c39540 [Sinorhizobium fredii USDA 257]
MHFLMESDMAVAYTVGPIKRHQVDKAYRLIDAAGCHFDLEAWREFCAATVARECPALYVEGIVTAENPLGYIAGVCIMRPVQNEIYGRMLDVPVFIIISAGDTRGVANSLVEYFMAVARKYNCGFIRVAALDPTDWPGSRATLPRDGRGILIPVQ